ncbi:uncharacterized protein ACOB8E_009247 isoform 1-T1 [Sarcophilus harrisii]
MLPGTQQDIFQLQPNPSIQIWSNQSENFLLHSTTRDIKSIERPCLHGTYSQVYYFWIFWNSLLDQESYHAERMNQAPPVCWETKDTRATTGGHRKEKHMASILVNTCLQGTCTFSPKELIQYEYLCHPTN